MKDLNTMLIYLRMVINMNVKPECEEVYELIKEKERIIQKVDGRATDSARMELEKELEELKKEFEECNGK